MWTIATPTGNNYKVLVISQIKATTPNMVTKIVSTGLSVTGRGCDLRLDMLEFFDSIEESWKTYCWDQYVANMIKNIYVKF